MKMLGWIRIQRAIFDHPFFADEPMSEREAFTWLVANAAWRETSHMVGRKSIPVPRGSMVVTLRELTRVWKWKSDKRVRGFLARMADHNMIEYQAVGQRSASRTIIAVVNYETHQTQNVHQGDFGQPKIPPAAASEPEVKQAPPPDVDETDQRDRVLAAIGDGAAALGTTSDMIAARKWSTDLELTVDEQIGVIRDVMSRRSTADPPTTFNFFNRAMQRCAGAKSAPPLKPTAPQEGRSNVRTSKEQDSLKAFVAGARGSS